VLGRRYPSTHLHDAQIYWLLRDENELSRTGLILIAGFAFWFLLAKETQLTGTTFASIALSLTMVPDLAMISSPTFMELRPGHEITVAGESDVSAIEQRFLGFETRPRNDALALIAWVELTSTWPNMRSA
jgi:hypothetical protein